MDLKKCKICVTIFSIVFSGIVLSTWKLKGILLFIWVLIWLAAAISYLANQKNRAAHYGISFELTVMLSAALLMAGNHIVQWGVFFGLLFSGLMALYRTCYQESEMTPMHVLKGINYLLFANLTIFLYPEKLPPKEKENRTYYKIAGVTAFLCFVLFVGLDRFADIHIANMLGWLWKIISENISYIALSIVMGLFLASALYGYMYGLLAYQLGQMGVEPGTYKHCPNNGNNLWTELFCNPICGTWVLNAIIFCDSILLIVNLFFYWDPFGLNVGAFGKAYRNSGFIPMLIIIVLSVCAFRGIYYILEYRGKKYSGNDKLFEKCRHRFIVAILATFLIEIFAVARYCNILYTNGINNSNKQGVFAILICMIALGYSAIYGFNLYRRSFLRGYFCVSMLLIMLTAFFWSNITIPMYNMFLFMDKYENRQLTYSSKDKSAEETVITLKDIDVYFMEESGLYATIPLVKLLNYSNVYEGTDGNVADAALESIGRIYAEEFSENKEEICAAKGIEKIMRIAEYMENDPSYMLGIRRWCRQSVTRYLIRHEQEK